MVWFNVRDETNKTYLGLFSTVAQRYYLSQTIIFVHKYEFLFYWKEKQYLFKFLSSVL